MKRFLICLLAVIMLFNIAFPKIRASADPATISALSAAAYALGQQVGINFGFIGGTAAGSQAYMENSLSSWVNSNGGISIFGLAPVRALAGALCLTQTAFNELKNFLNDFILDNNLTVENPVYLSEGMVGNIQLGTENSAFFENDQSTGLWAVAYLQGTPDESDVLPGYYKRGQSSQPRVRVGANDVTSSISGGTSGHYIKATGWKVEASTSVQGRYNFTIYWSDAGSNEQNPSMSTAESTISVNTTAIPVTNRITGQLNHAASYPDVGLDDLDTYKRQDWDADTNLEQMLQDIFEDVADNSLDLEEEVIEDTINPQPTVIPQPTTVPGDLTLDDIGDLIGDATGVLEGIEEGVGEIAEDVADVADGVGDIVDALDVPAANDFRTPSLNTLFPFCIPFDLYNIVMAFNVPAEAPHVQIPFNIPVLGLSYTFDLDFSQFNGVASTVRTMEFVAFAVGLAILSSKVIRW